MHFRPNVLPPIVYPTKCCVTHTCQKTIVPHIHPSHTTNVNHHRFDHLHYYPHTQSFANEVSHQHFHCGPVVPPGLLPAAPAAPVAPGAPVAPTAPMGGPTPFFEG